MATHLGPRRAALRLPAQSPGPSIGGTCVKLDPGLDSINKTAHFTQLTWASLQLPEWLLWCKTSTWLSAICWNVMTISDLIWKISDLIWKISDLKWSKLNWHHETHQYSYNYIVSDVGLLEAHDHVTMLVHTQFKNPAYNYTISYNPCWITKAKDCLFYPQMMMTITQNLLDSGANP
jgi:hypothetical protein